MIKDLHLDIIYCRRKSMQVRAISENKLQIRAPLGLAKSDIEKALESKPEMVNRLLSNYIKLNAGVEYQDGSPIPYQGKDIYLRYRTMPGRSWAFDEARGILSIRTDLQGYTERVLKDFYGVTAERLRNRCLKLGRLHKLEPAKVSLRWNTSKWGSCSAAGRISLSKTLIMAPPEIQDYIILHELCHLIHFDHSKDFYLLMEKLDPDYRQHWEWIKRNASSLRIKPQKA